MARRVNACAPTAQQRRKGVHARAPRRLRPGNGPDGKELAADFTIALTRPYQDFAPDCMGAWVLYWCQGMPGLGNRCLADDGTPMKNWWVYLIY